MVATMRKLLLGICKCQDSANIMASAPSVTYNLAGASWCHYTDEAKKSLQNAEVDVYQDGGYFPVDQMIRRVDCDRLQDNVSVEAQVCAVAHSYPVLVACYQEQCGIIVDGYYPDFAKRCVDAIEKFNIDGQFLASQ